MDGSGEEAVARALKDAEEAEVAVRAGAGGRKRSSRRATIAPSRYGEFLSWDNVKAIGTPGGKGPKQTDDANAADETADEATDAAHLAADDGDDDNQRKTEARRGDDDDDDDYEEDKSGAGAGAAGDNHNNHGTRRSTRGTCGMGNGDNGMTCPIPSFVPAASDPTVKEVHDKVSALMQMARDFLPPGPEDDEDEQGGAGGGAAGARRGGKKGGKKGAKGVAAAKVGWYCSKLNSVG